MVTTSSALSAIHKEAADIPLIAAISAPLALMLVLMVANAEKGPLSETRLPMHEAQPFLPSRGVRQELQPLTEKGSWKTVWTGEPPAF